jgi:hypothetical protein
MKVAIVGPQEDKWLPYLKDRAKQVIEVILIQYQFERDLTIVSGGCPLGGVDIWAVELAKQRGINTDVIKPDVNQWEDRYATEYENQYIPVPILKGFKSRNIAIAKDCDVLYCIVPNAMIGFNVVSFNPKCFCKHCKVWKHPTNGGCWTMKYANKIGKETHLVVVE